MARYNFGGSLTDFAITSPSARANAVFAQPNATGSVYAARTGGSALTDLLDSNGSATTTVSSDANGFVNRFQGPDGYAELWVDFGGGSRFFIRAIDGISTRPSTSIKAFDYGVRAGTGADQKSAILSALSAAESASPGTVVELPPGVITISGTLPLSGYSCGLVGHGATTASAGSNTPAGTVLQAVSQTGPVLDFTGWRPPRNFIGRVQFGGFTIQGDGVVATANKGIYMGDPSGSVYGISMRDVTITNTGGIGWDAKDVYLSDFDAITVVNPINPATNNTSYVRMIGCNGNRVRGLGLRSLLTSGDVPAAGALRCEASTFQFHDTLFDGLWLENLHISTGNTAILMQTNQCVISDMQVFDCFKEAAATGTSLVRFEPSAVTDGGGNVMRGIIPGRDTSANAIDYGVEVRQSYNRIEGVKGYRGNNVLITSGILGTTVFLGGSMGTATDAAVTDSSGNTSNTIVDAYLGQWTLGVRSGTTATMKVGGVDLRPGFIDGGTVAANFNPNMSGGNNSFRFTLGASGIALNGPSNSQARPLTIMLKQDATGSRTITWNSIYKFAGGTAPTLSTTAGKTDVFAFVFDGTNWIETARTIGVS